MSKEFKVGDQICVTLARGNFRGVIEAVDPSPNTKHPYYIDYYDPCQPEIKKAWVRANEITHAPALEPEQPEFKVGDAVNVFSSWGYTRGVITDIDLNPGSTPPYRVEFREASHGLFAGWYNAPQIEHLSVQEPVPDNKPVADEIVGEYGENPHERHYWGTVECLGCGKDLPPKFAYLIDFGHGECPHCKQATYRCKHIACRGLLKKTYTPEGIVLACQDCGEIHK